MWLAPTRERAHDTDVLAHETKFARAPDGVHIAWACSRVRIRVQMPSPWWCLPVPPA